MNIISPEHKANPFPLYARLRAELQVHRVSPPHKREACLVSRYDDVTTVLKDQRFTTEKLRWRRGLVLRGLKLLLPEIK